MTTATRTDQLKARLTGQVATAADKPKTLAGLLSDPKIKNQMALALPKHLNADRLARIALTEIRKVPALAKCNQESFLGAVMQCAQLGLEPGNALGHAYLLPFGNGKASDGLANVQLIIGYRGMIDLARRSGQIISISAHTVHEQDKFSYQLGLDPNIIHVPADNERGEVTHVYAVAKLKDGGVQFEVMSRFDVEKVRKTSKAAQNGPWVSHWEEMAKKTVCRRLFKWLPVSIELQTAVTLDERADAGKDQDNAAILTGEYSVVDDGAPALDDQPQGQGAAPSFDIEAYKAKIAKCSDIDALDIMADEFSGIADGEAFQQLSDLYHARRAELLGD
ncbi:recombination protein RecT [Chromobacterium haemolyticum]|uniref:recombination protein RecT n=1 Tax=Chromobacterium haemolyticum TaxID=394935 RepID=UPI0009DB2DD5|nr:recombination protein RecT [Chromobacterium haemolyticum]OQS41156.1 recombinase RecT [Chromobacterium haemolyticum]